ncbi:MAG: hypothetical protein IJV03_00095 [Alphaproteobacteria bacterium]|nr:hypothetical protein [Alphaproteobacteria bacterium]
MFDLFDIFSNKKPGKPDSVPQQKPVLVQPEKEYDFVEKYVLIDPKQVMAQYNLWSSSKMVPVAYERQRDSISMFNECVLLPTKHFMGYLEELRKTPYEITNSPLARTVYIVHLNNNNTMYIYPNLKDIKTPWVAFDNRKTWFFDVNQKINRATCECLKQYTRQK